MIESIGRATFVRTSVSGSNQPERICVLGGGFGGLYTALRLQKMPWRGRRPVVTLVDKRDKFTFLPLLYEFASELSCLSFCRSRVLRCSLCRFS